MSASFTVLIPVLNGMPYIEECLLSLEQQTRKDFSVYVWDNGSTDGTRECLEAWVPKRLPGKLFFDQPLPLGDCRAALINASPTECCALLDADDRCYPNRFEAQLQFWDKRPELAMFGTHIQCIDADGNQINQASELPLSALDIRCHQLRANAFRQSTMMLSKAACQAVGNFRNLKCEDYEIQLRIAAKYESANMEDTLLEYRVHHNSTSAGYGVDPGNMDFAINALSQNAPTAYGISAEAMTGLRTKKIPYAYPLLKEIAKTIAGQSKCQEKDVFENKFFRAACSWMIRSDDWKTQLQLLRQEPFDLNTLRRVKQIAVNATASD
ncbi:glycosyltransferase [Cerasicoccus fimbriatus]|uniref:glycosyltransferase n=1 Tax=Cerasicoccus fimbriatus TaxID=3014554 RepID=UPI0022B2B443|nr:glycosyltransferase [Cerasicoccus sp. TK19100]